MLQILISNINLSSSVEIALKICFVLTVALKIEKCTWAYMHMQVTNTQRNMECICMGSQIAENSTAFLQALDGAKNVSVMVSISVEEN